MAKMCKNFTTTHSVEWNREECDKAILNGIKCPKNTNSRCQIIPKRKSKVRKVKAWFFKDEDGNIIVFNTYGGSQFKPCTILIEEKYLKERKP